MAEEFISYRIRARLVIVTAITLFFYITLVYSLFFMKDIFQSLLFVFLFFIAFHFFYIEIKKYKLRYFLIGALILSGIETVFVGLNIWQYIASLFVFNLGIFAFVATIEVPLKRKIRFNSLSYFTIGGYIFTVFTTITYSFALIGMYSQFPFKCEDLSKSTNTVVDFFTKPLRLGLDKASDIKKDTQSFFTATLDTTLGKKTSVQPQTKFTSFINDYREKMIDQVVKDNKSINMGICDYVLGEINSRYNKPVFQFSLILLMYLLFYPFLRIIFWIMSIVGIVIFKALLGLNTYKIEKVLKEVEEIN